MIKLSSQHVYHSGLAWCPSSSLTRTLYQHELGLEMNVMHGIDLQWASCIRTIPVMPDPSKNFDVCAIAISRRDDMMAFGGLGNRYHISDAASGSVISVLQGSAEATCVTFSADGSLFASGDEGGDIRVWDIQTGIYKVLFQGGEENRAKSIAFAPKGTLLASGTEDGDVRIWDVISEELPPNHIVGAHADYVTSVCWSNEGSKLLSGSLDMSMKIWDTPTGNCLHIIQAERWIDCVAWSPDGSKIGLSTTDKITIYDAQTYDQLDCFQTNGMGIRKSFDFSSKGDHVVYGSGKLVLVRNLNLAIDVSSFVGHTDGVASVAFSAGATFVVSGGEDGLIKVWWLGSEEQGSDHEQERSEVPAAVSFSPSGRLMATATRGKREVELWDPMTCSNFDTLFLDLEQVGLYPCLAFSPDSSFIACGFGPDKLIRIWDANTRAVISDFHVPIFDLFCLAPDGNRLGVVAGRVVQLWDVRQGNIVAALTWSKSISGRKITFFEDGSGILITCYGSDPIKLDIIASSNRSLPFEFVASSNESPRGILNHDLYRLAEHPYDWVLDSKNRRVCWVPPDQRLNPSTVGDANGSRIAWSSHKELIYLDFSYVPTAEKE